MKIMVRSLGKIRRRALVQPVVQPETSSSEKHKAAKTKACAQQLEVSTRVCQVGSSSNEATDREMCQLVRKEVRNSRRSLCRGRHTILINDQYSYSDLMLLLLFLYVPTARMQLNEGGNATSTVDLVNGCLHTNRITPPLSNLSSKILLCSLWRRTVIFVVLSRFARLQT